MDVSLSGTLLAAVLLFAHIIAIAALALVAYATMNVIRLQPDIRYLFWSPFIGGSLAWGYTAKKLLTSNIPFSWWADSALSWYGILAVGGLLIGIFIQRSRL
ncbi:MAG TPA: hypothetical protein VHS96_11390 [Bacteroidia bacterium]|nr:hypothetical protein [Bacteroidia bacterium]